MIKYVKKTVGLRIYINTTLMTFCILLNSYLRLNLISFLFKICILLNI